MGTVGYSMYNLSENIRDETIWSSHDTIRIDTKGDDMVIFDTIWYNTDKHSQCSHIYKHSQCSNPFIYEHNIRMLRLVSFTNTVARFTKKLDKTNLFVKLKNNAQLSF